MATKLTLLGALLIALLLLVSMMSAVSPATPTATGDDAAPTASRARDDVDAKAILKDVNGNDVGVVRFDARRGGRVEVEAEVNIVDPAERDKFHGFHLHTTGLCDPPFTSAGGHFNPDDTVHGQHAGDFPVLLVMASGRAVAKFKTDRFELSQLFDDDGSAVIIHAGLDNYANIPPERYHSHTEDVFGPDSMTKATGDAGARFACGVVRRT